ncbi:ABC transporter permease [Saccharospirillum sp. MSK14-1]|uniref:FecCD family ABC transporter permease n=1 Tax=Saccharospirillum sp. MSK14-1 TaxID=1897632 RepID=UPI000D4D9729|nr:iron ABC transporter permease [Saccharospirillum sp. MSK14-1]PTY36172.1 ABC transporter permease [Saccharospirillum sp. MSK14-1]
MPLAVRYVLLIAVVVAAALWSLTLGQRGDIHLSNILSLLWVDDGSLARSAVIDLRLPRTLVALFVGVNLALAGLALQAVTRNPLASESILGINQGASLGVALAVVLPFLAGVPLDLMAILGAALAGLVTFAIAGGLGGRLDSIRLILAGVAVGAFSYACVRFTYTLDDDLSRLVINWVSADISSVSVQQVLPLIAWSFAGVLGSLLLAHGFNVLALGDGASQGLGIDPRRVRFLGAALAAVLTGASVAVAGPVMFVGLVVPHLCRFWFGQNHRALVPAVALGGGALLVLADAVSKLVRFPYETPLGVVCALIGAPYFLYATLTARRLA